MARTFIHAPDGGSIPGSLCQEPTGDCTTRENEVTCPEYLDELERIDKTFDQLAAPLQLLWEHRPTRKT